MPLNLIYRTGRSPARISYSSGVRLGLILTAALFLVLSVVLLLPASLVRAHGSIPLIVDDVISGPYMFRIGVQPSKPRVGPLRVSTLVMPAVGTEPMKVESVAITATGPVDGLSLGPVEAKNSQGSPLLFVADIQITELGIWTMSVAVDGELGATTLQVPFEATEGGIGVPVFSISVIVIVLGVIIAALVWSQKQRRRGQIRGSKKGR